VVERLSCSHAPFSFKKEKGARRGAKKKNLCVAFIARQQEVVSSMTALFENRKCLAGI